MSGVLTDFNTCMASGTIIKLLYVTDKFMILGKSYLLDKTKQILFEFNFPSFIQIFDGYNYVK